MWANITAAREDPCTDYRGILSVAGGREEEELKTLNLDSLSAAQAPFSWD